MCLRQTAADEAGTDCVDRPTLDLRFFDLQGRSDAAVGKILADVVERQRGHGEEFDLTLERSSVKCFWVVRSNFMSRERKKRTVLGNGRFVRACPCLVFLESTAEENLQ
jgi:hypothetical protein